MAKPREEELELPKIKYNVNGGWNRDTAKPMEEMYRNYTFNIALIRYLQKQHLDENIGFDEDFCAWAYPSKIQAERIKMDKNCHQIIKEKKDKPVNEVKFCIEMSYLRPMIPILERLKKEGIEYYVPPNDEDTIKYHPTKKIYMNREDLKRYREKVHNEISNGTKGVVEVELEDINQADLILGDFPEQFLGRFSR